MVDLVLDLLVTLTVITGLVFVIVDSIAWIIQFVIHRRWYRTAKSPPEQPEKKHPQDDVERHVRLVGEWMCYAAGMSYRVNFQVEDDAHIRAWIDFSDWTIRITKGFYNDCRSEDELAAVLAHEIGHLAIKIGKKSGSGSRIDQEYKADQLAASYLSNAGYDPNALARQLWRHTVYDLRVGDPDFLNRQGFTHPPFIKRIVAANSAVRLLPQTS